MSQHKQVVMYMSRNDEGDKDLDPLYDLWPQKPSFIRDGGVALPKDSQALSTIRFFIVAHDYRPVWSWCRLMRAFNRFFHPQLARQNDSLHLQPGQLAKLTINMEIIK